jgi:hypothetical protein
VKRIACIEISFPETVEVSDDDQRALIELVARICAGYEKANVGRVMWPFGFGFKMLANPMMLSDDEPIPFDESTFAIECSERADYEWPCAKCGKEQGDHQGHITNPPAGACEFEPQSRELAKTSGTA